MSFEDFCHAIFRIAGAVLGLHFRNRTKPGRACRRDQKNCKTQHQYEDTRQQDIAEREGGGAELQKRLIQKILVFHGESLADSYALDEIKTGTFCKV